MTNFTGVFPTPTSSGGAVTQYQVSPSLPSGLEVSTTGQIVGVPQVVSSLQVYTITASNSGGSCDETINITVLAEPPSGLTYGGGSDVTQEVTLGAQMHLAPHVSAATTAGGSNLTFTVQPPLMNGVTIDPQTGVISGEPTALLWPGNSYVVTVSSTGGHTNTTVTIAVLAVKPTKLVYPTSGFTYPSYVTGTSGDDSYAYKYTHNKEASFSLVPTHDGLFCGCLL